MNGDSLLGGAPRQLSLGRADDEHRNSRLPQDRVCHGAEEQACQPGPPMRHHADQVGLAFPGAGDDLWGGLTRPHRRGHAETISNQTGGHPPQVCLGLLPLPFPLVHDDLPGTRLHDFRRGRGNDSQQGDLQSERPGQPRHERQNGLRQWRAVEGNEGAVIRLRSAHKPSSGTKDLITGTTQVVQAARAVLAAAAGAARPEPLATAHLAAVEQEIVHYCTLTDQVVAQARRRVLEGETVPTTEKLFSIFEPHTDLIKRNKARNPVEFGHKIFLAESAIGLITDYRILEGNPTDDHRVAPSLERHQELFGTVPALYAADRGFYSPTTLAGCQTAGVATECIPQRGGTKTAARAAYEKSRRFKKGQRFRAGIEGRISVLFRAS